MSTLYRSVLIESVEQAEALPLGTVAVRLDDDGLVWTAARRCRCEESGCDAWFSTDWADPEPHAGLVGHTALVPIEAEEETGCDVHDPPCIGCRPLWDDKEE